MWNKKYFYQKSLLDLVHEFRRVMLVKLQAVPRDALSFRTGALKSKLSLENTFYPCPIPASCPEKWWTDKCAWYPLWKYLFAFSLLGCRVSFVVHIHHRNVYDQPQFLWPASSLGSFLIGEIGISGRGGLSYDNYVMKHQLVLVLVTLFWLLARP